MPIRNAHFMRAMDDLAAFDKKHDNVKHAKKHIPPWVKVEFIPSEYERLAYYSNARIGADYFVLHAMLRHISGGRLRGKRILHLGGSTGVYAHFLKEVEGAQAENIDLDKHAHHDASRIRQIKTMLGSAIPGGRGRSPMILPKGVWMRRNEATLLYPNNYFDFLVSDHFLFSDFHTEIGGFEKRKGSAEQSFNSLKEYNRIMKMGGRLVVGDAHRDVTDLRKIKKGQVIHGFVVEEEYDSAMYKSAKAIGEGVYQEVVKEEAERMGGRKPYGHAFFVLKKVANLKRERQFVANSKGKTQMMHRI